MTARHEAPLPLEPQRSSTVAVYGDLSLWPRMLFAAVRSAPLCRPSGFPGDAVIRYETAIKADKPVLIAHRTRIAVERACDVLAGAAAESVEVHVGDSQMVA